MYTQKFRLDFYLFLISAKFDRLRLKRNFLKKVILKCFFFGILIYENSRKNAIKSENFP